MDVKFCIISFERVLKLYWSKLACVDRQIVHTYRLYLICLGKLGVDEIWVWFHTDPQFRIWSTTGCRQRSCICELATDSLNLKRFLSFSFSMNSWVTLAPTTFFCCYFSWLVCKSLQVATIFVSISITIWGWTTVAATYNIHYHTPRQTLFIQHTTNKPKQAAHGVNQCWEAINFFWS